jgi:hypothetical protein
VPARVSRRGLFLQHGLRAKAARAAAAGKPAERPQLRLIATILITVAALAAILEAFTALATVLKALAALLTLTPYETLAVSAAIAALIETRTVPAVEVKAQCGFFDRVNPFERQGDVGRSA